MALISTLMRWCISCPWNYLTNIPHYYRRCFFSHNGIFYLFFPVLALAAACLPTFWLLITYNDNFSSSPFDEVSGAREWVSEREIIFQAWIKHMHSNNIWSNSIALKFYILYTRIHRYCMIRSSICCLLISSSNMMALMSRPICAFQLTDILLRMKR